MPYNAFGELKNEDGRFAAGLQNDVFNPQKPNVISLAALFTTGNTGSFRSQARIERFIRPSDASEYTIQVALSGPIQSVFGRRDLRIQEDNGWPNVEGRVSMGLGETETLVGNRKARPFEMGSSAFHGQIRTTRSVLAPQDPQSPIRSVVDCWGFGIDSPLRRASDTFVLTQNQTFFANLVWNWSKNVQISNQVDYRKTNYRSPLLDATGCIFYSEFQWKF